MAFGHQGCNTCGVSAVAAQEFKNCVNTHMFFELHCFC
jgi:hypothetical protein